MLRADGVGASGGTPATATLGGALLNAASGSTLSLTGGYIQAANGGQVNVDPGATNSLITLRGGTQTLAASAIGISSGGQFTGGSASASLIELDNARLTGANSVLQAGGSGRRGDRGHGDPGRSATQRGQWKHPKSRRGVHRGGQRRAGHRGPGVTTSLITLHGGSHALGGQRHRRSWVVVSSPGAVRALH